MAEPRFNPGGALLLVLITTALVALGSGVAARFLPMWRPGPLIAASVLVAGEAALLRYRMRRGHHLSMGALSYLAAELFALAVLMRLAATLSADLADLPQRLELWLRSPLAALDMAFVLHLSVGLLVALAVRGGMRELDELEPATIIMPDERGLDIEQLRAALDRQGSDAVERIVGGLAWGGAFALVALAVQVADFRRFGGPAQPLAPASALAGLLYLVSAVLLYSRARLGLLRSRWLREQVAVEPAVLGRWRVGSAALVLAVAAFGLLLPRGYGASIFDAVQSLGVTLIQLLSLVSLFFTALALGALSLVLAIPAMIVALLIGNTESVPTAPAPLPPVSTPVPPPAPVEPPLGPGVVFWVCIALLAGYALFTVLRRQEWAVAAWGRVRSGLLAPLRAWLARVWVGTSDYARKVSEALAERREAPVQAARPTRARAPGPAGLVRWLYGVMLARAAEGGIDRRAADTPYEYRARLGEQLPEATEAVDGLTDAYVAAAYAPRPVTPAQASTARRLLGRVRRALRARVSR